MTPSEAHESAWKREPGHDEMVVDVKEYLESLGEKWVQRPDSKSRGSLCSLIWSDCEAYIEGDGGNIGFFADIFLQWRAEDSSYEAVQCFEIKPKIHSCGALLRQLKVQNSRMRHRYTNSQNTVVLITVPVIRHDDPLFPTLRRMMKSPIMTWDGEKAAWWRYRGDRYYTISRPQSISIPPTQADEGGAKQREVSAEENQPVAL